MLREVVQGTDGDGVARWVLEGWGGEFGEGVLDDSGF